jgi:subtilase family serine protease
VGVSAVGLATPASAHSQTPTRLADTPLVMVPAMLGGLSHATRVGDAPAGQSLTIGIEVTGTNATAETALAAAQANRSSPDYRSYLTPASFAAEFGVPASREQQIVSYLTAGGLTVAPTSAAGTYITATGTIAQLQNLFQVTEGSYAVGPGSAKTFLANEDPPQVPSGLGIAAISGLDTLRQFYTADQTRTSLSATQQAAAVARAHAQAAAPTVNTPVVATQTLQPRDLWSLYNQPSTDLGQGQTSGVFGEGETDSVITQLRLFETAEGFPKVPVTVIRTEGDTDDDADYGDNTGSIEWYLDVQAMTGMAPDLAHLDLYFAKTLFDHDVFASFNDWANDPNGPRQMNASFGECETNPTNPVTGPLAQLPYGTELGDELEPIGEPVLEQASLEGRTLFASAGDTGSGCPAYVVPVLGAGNGVAPSVPPLVNYPAASDYAVGVGGTVITAANTSNNTPGTASSATRTEEASWEDTGGGASHFITEPTFQSKVSNVDKPCLTQPDGTPFTGVPPTCRGVPDVAALSGNTLGNGYFIYIDGAPSAEGGTSLSSPLTVGMWTRLQAASSVSGGLGFAAPVLYGQYDYQTKGATGSYGRDFFDVVDEESGATNGTEMPAPGWDYTSGLGVFNVGGLLTDLDGTTTAVSSAVPAETPALATCSTTENSPAGNATDPAEVQLGNDPELDLTQSNFSVDSAATTMTVTITGPDFTDPDTDSGTAGDDFTADWLYNGVVYFIKAHDDSGTFTVTDGNNNGATPAATDTAKATLSSDGTTLTLSAPLSELGSPTSGQELYYPSVDAALDLGGAVGTITVLSLNTDSASAIDYTQQTVGQAIELGPTCQQPGSDVPEAPETVLLPVAGGLVALAYLVLGPLRRRRRHPPIEN